MKLQETIDREELLLDTEKPRQLTKHKSEKLDYEELLKEFMFQWKLKRDKQINSDEYYAVVRFAQWLCENT